MNFSRILSYLKVAILVTHGSENHECFFGRRLSNLFRPPRSWKRSEPSWTTWKIINARYVCISYIFRYSMMNSFCFCPTATLSVQCGLLNFYGTEQNRKHNSRNELLDFQKWWVMSNYLIQPRTPKQTLFPAGPWTATTPALQRPPTQWKVSTGPEISVPLAYDPWENLYWGDPLKARSYAWVAWPTCVLDPSWEMVVGSRLFGKDTLWSVCGHIVQGLAKRCFLGCVNSLFGSAWL